MQEYPVRRLLLLIPTALRVTLVFMLIMQFIPGDPLAILCTVLPRTLFEDGLRHAFDPS